MKRRRATAAAAGAWALSLLAVACGGSGSSESTGSTGGTGGTTPPPAPLVPTANAGRAIVATALTADLSTRQATAVITLAPEAAPGATLEAGDLVLNDVTLAGQPLAWSRRGGLVDLALPAATGESTVTLRYQFQWHSQLDGASADGYSFTWPSACGNMFPCQSLPARGQRFTLALQGVPAGQRAIQAAVPLVDAPAYQLAWAVGNYTDVALGTTAAGTRLVASYQPGQEAAMRQGTAYLKNGFAWFETTLGPYRFGAEAGPAAVSWPPSAYGGMEHHPRWHVAAVSLADPLLHLHEAAHGWFGDGVRLACWEDFVLSEGTASYLAGRALDATAPGATSSPWAYYAAQLSALSGQEPVWPESCNRIDVVKDGLYTQAPYVRGALFYRALALKLGDAAVDRVLGRFYAQYAGKAAGMQDMLATVRSETGYDPTACARTWLRTAARPVPQACP